MERIDEDVLNPELNNVTQIQYSVVDNNKFFGSGITTTKLKPGVYSVLYDNTHGAGLLQKSVLDTIWLPINSAQIQFVFDDFELFWTKKKVYREHKQVFKRGTILYGAQGCGKSQLIAELSRNLIKKNGITVYNTISPDILSQVIDMVRVIERGRPLMVVIEDIDSLINAYGESRILQILDGFSSQENIYYIATTNFPEKLKERITNRPQRFDIAIEIPLPDANARASFIIAKAKQFGAKINIKDYVKHTDGMSFAHIQEVFTSTLIMGYGLKDTVARLTDMKYPKKSNPSTKIGLQNVH